MKSHVFSIVVAQCAALLVALALVTDLRGTCGDCEIGCDKSEAWGNHDGGKHYGVNTFVAFDDYCVDSSKGTKTGTASTANYNTYDQLFLHCVGADEIQTATITPESKKNGGGSGAVHKTCSKT